MREHAARRWSWAARLQNADELLRAVEILEPLGRVGLLGGNELRDHGQVSRVERLVGTRQPLRCAGSRRPAEQRLAGEPSVAQHARDLVGEHGSRDGDRRVFGDDLEQPRLTQHAAATVPAARGHLPHRPCGRGRGRARRAPRRAAAAHASAAPESRARACRPPARRTSRSAARRTTQPAQRSPAPRAACAARSLRAGARRPRAARAGVPSR